VDDQTPIPGSVLPIGYAVEDTEVLLLDDERREVVAGEIGEIAVRTRFASPGYWRRPELTRERFLLDPEGSDARVYLTGDLGRVLPDGCLVHVGRKEHHVKIRGQRIETAEIERALLDLDTIREAVVVVREGKEESTSDSVDGDRRGVTGKGEPRLVAYLVPASWPAPTVSALRRALAQQLPDAMLPSAFVVLDGLPLNANGKVDRHALPALDGTRPELSVPYAPPRSPMEEVLTGIWAEVLELEQVGIHDDFLELGGHSLLATQVLSRVRSAFRVQLSQQALLGAPTVAEMAVEVARSPVEGTGGEGIDALLLELEQLSEEEARQFLVARETSDETRARNEGPSHEGGAAPSSPG
jgi:hypothetical protein